MFGDLYFCAMMRMSPEDSHAFVATLKLLRRSGVSRREVFDAIGPIRAMQPWMQLYAVRALMRADARLGSAANRRSRASTDGTDDPADQSNFAGDADLDQAIWEICQSILDATDDPLAPELGTRIGQTLRDEEGAIDALIRHVAAPVAAQRRTHRVEGSTRPYQDLSEHVVATLAVIVFAEYSARYPSQAAGLWIGDEALAVAAAALSGDYGRLALLAAADAAARVDPQVREVLWRNIWREGRGALELQPDLLEALARLWFGHRDSISPPDIDDLEIEALTRRDLGQLSEVSWSSSERSAAAYEILGGHPGDDWLAMSSVLWQTVLWSEATETDPIETAKRLNRWWQAPQASGGREVTLHTGGAGSHGCFRPLRALQRRRPYGGARFSVDDAPTTETTPDVGSALFSPWLERWHDGWDHERRDKRAFRRSGESESLLWLLGSVTIALDLLAARPSLEDAVRPELDFVKALVFHAADVLRDNFALLKQIEHGEHNGEDPLGEYAVAALWHVHLSLQDAGQGRDGNIDPRILGDFAYRWLSDESTADLTLHEQRARLARQVLSSVCVLWLNESFRGSAYSNPLDGCSRWFAGSPALAQRVLLVSMDRATALWDEHQDLLRQEGVRKAKIKEWNNSRTADPEGADPSQKRPHFGRSFLTGLWPPDVMPSAQLFREAYPELWPSDANDRWPRLERADWYKHADRFRGPYQQYLLKANNDVTQIKINAINRFVLLLAPIYSVEVWREFSAEVDGWARIDGTPLIMRAIRLDAVLREPDGLRDPDCAAWVDDWMDCIYAVAEPDQIPSEVRTLMIRQLGGAVGALVDDRDRAAVARLLASLHAATVDAILESGIRWTRHIEMLFDRLRTHFLVRGELADRTCLRALETVERVRRIEPTWIGIQSPRESRQLRADRDAVEHTILQFIAAAISADSGGVDPTTFLGRAQEAWMQNQLRPLVAPVSVPLARRRHPTTSRRPFAEIAVAASTVDRYRAREVSFLLDAETERGRGVRVLDLFSSKKFRQEKLSQISTGQSRLNVLAVVCAVEAVSEGGTRTWLNCGLEQPLALSVPTGGPRYEAGDVVSAVLSGPTVTVLSAHRLDWQAPRDGEVRRSEVTDTKPWLTVTVEGSRAYRYPTSGDAAAVAIRRLWDPDLSRTFTPQHEPASEQIVVRYSSDLSSWVPADRSLKDVVVDESAGSSPIRLVYVGPADPGGSSWRFVTRPGRLYVLSEHDWSNPDRLLNILAEASCGTIVFADIEVTPKLALALVAEDVDGLQSVDDDNVAWAQLFSDSELDCLIAVRDEAGVHRIETGFVDGFPRSIVAGGLESENDRVLVQLTEWGDKQAREARANATLVPANGIERPKEHSAERFDAMFDIVEGQIMKLRRRLSQRVEGTSLLAATETEVVVRLEAESLTLLNVVPVGRNTPGLVDGRAVRVTGVYDTPNPGASSGPSIPIDEILRTIDPVDTDTDTVRDLLTDHSFLDGVVVTRFLIGTSKNSGLVYGTWCRVAGTVFYVELGQGAFADAPAQVTGQLFVGERHEDGWRFHFRRRSIVVRGLFTLESALDDTSSYMFVGSSGNEDVFQHPARPVLITQQKSTENVIDRLGLRRAKIRSLEHHDSKAVIRRISLESGNATLLGATSFAGQLQGAQVTDVKLAVNRLGRGSDDADAFVEVRRMLKLGARTSSLQRGGASIDHASRWQRFITSQEDHLIGEIVHDGGYLEVAGGIQPPRPDGTLSPRLKLLSGEEGAAVAGVRYLKSRARVRLVPDGSGYVGSIARAVPKSIEEFIQHIRYSSADGGREVVKEPLYYVRPPTPDDPAHVFEWGFGWTVAIPDEQLRMSGAFDSGGLALLFHGDRIRAVAFVQRKDGPPVMIIDWRDLAPRYVRRIIEEANSGHLHLVDVEIESTERVRVMRAQTSKPEGNEISDALDGAEWVPFPATLDAESIKALLGRLTTNGESGLVRARVLARLDVSTAVGSGGTKRHFKALSLDGDALRAGDRVFLTATGLVITDNEVTVVFTIPGAVNTENLEVKVNRRDFSFRESTLMQLHNRGVDFTSGGIQMLVKLFAQKGRSGAASRKGTVRDAPLRRPETLKSYLFSKGGHSYAIAGSASGSSVVEISPGVIFDAKGIQRDEPAQSGAIVLLSISDAGGITQTTALPGDIAYVSNAGRPAVLFPKESLLGSNAANRENWLNGGFTVSGLADISGTASPADSETLLSVRHPKIGTVARANSGVTVRAATRNVEMLRFVGPDPRMRAALKVRVSARHAVNEELSVPWAQLSFADTTAREIALASRHNEWTHHDKSSGHLERGRQKPNDVPSGSGVREGVFFEYHGGPTLRYHPKALATYGFPASSLIDDADQWPKGVRTFAVAGTSTDLGGVWIEYAPGRIVEIRGPLVTADGRNSLTQFAWALFSSGDEVDLRLARHTAAGADWDATPNHVILAGWRSSLRSSREVGLLLVVRSVDRADGALVLGNDHWRLVYPMAIDETDGYQPGATVRVSSRNAISVASADWIEPGDIALLTATRDGTLAVEGLDGFDVKLADEGPPFPGYRWLRQRLESPQKVKLLNAVGGSLPITVDAVNVDTAKSVVISRRSQRPGTWPANRTVRTELMGALGNDQLVVTAGSALFLVQTTEAVQGSPRALEAGIARCLLDAAERHGPVVMWWHTDSMNRRTPGIGRRELTRLEADVEVVPEYEVAIGGLASGVVCRNTANSQLHWLPAEDATWMRDVPAGALLDNLRTSAKMTVRQEANGSVSVTKYPANTHFIERLRLGTSMRVVLGVGSPVRRDDGRWRYVARIDVRDVLVSYVSSDGNLRPGVSRLVEVDELDLSGHPSITVVDVNSRTVTLDLPQWLIDAHANNAPGLRCVADFAKYQRWYRGSADDEDDASNAPILRLAGHVIVGGDSDELDNGAVAGALTAWMKTHGTAALNIDEGTEVDVAPFLAMLVVLDYFSERHPALGPASVLALHQLGRRAMASIHTEQFALNWINRPERQGLPGAWMRLRSLELMKDLNRRQVRQLHEFCTAMLIKPVLRTVESDLAGIARCLLASIGELDSGARLIADAPTFAEMAVWGRSLVASSTSASAQAALFPSQRASLRTIADRVINDAMPLTFMPVVAPLKPAEHRLAADLALGRPLAVWVPGTRSSSERW
ncbi:hypothetical protein [Mycolicibacterium sp.]|uniref:hypothetical protein n=1 Tax=Mycolicibacterium sp. TaxID=2320850 RepID=UPI001A1FBFCA|nr:hypothetical protein [Mycolicibacterium sp.]MBJ7336057.1 hypothetical protein [Mycolicibacterium sp.]